MWDTIGAETPADKTNEYESMIGLNQCDLKVDYCPTDVTDNDPSQTSGTS